MWITEITAFVGWNVGEKPVRRSLARCKVKRGFCLVDLRLTGNELDHLFNVSYFLSIFTMIISNRNTHVKTGFSRNVNFKTRFWGKRKGFWPASDTLQGSLFSNELKYTSTMIFKTVNVLFVEAERICLLYVMG